MSDALLELAVLGGVDEWVDASVGEHQNHGEVVEPVPRWQKDGDLTDQEHCRGLHLRDVDCRVLRER